MKIEILKKLVISFLITIVMFNFIGIKNYAVDSIDDVISGGDSFLGAADEEKLDNEKMKSASSVIYNVLLSLGVIIAVIIATVLGIQYMLAGADSKAKVKESMIPFVIGCVVVFGAFGIWKVIVTAFILN